MKIACSILGARWTEKVGIKIMKHRHTEDKQLQGITLKPSWKSAVWIKP